MIGTVIGGYQITDRLAEGGMGAVFVARHQVMGRDAVVKLLLPELSHNEEMVRRFFNEAKAAASIQDPGIVQVFDVGYLPDGRAYIVMERLRGETLASRLRTRGLRIDQTVHFLRLLARTLDAAHEHSIVHRDLKPDNIFLVPDKDVAGGERIKILDFGIAKLAGTQTHHATQSGSIFGTPAYMAPEQCSDAGLVDARADLYAVGCIAYEMLSGLPPFGMGGIELLAAHLRDEPAALRLRNPDVPPWLEAVVHRLLRKHPNERFQSAAELHGALDPARQSPLASTASTITPQPFPVITAQPPVAAPLTTHSAAAGAMTTMPPQQRSRLRYVIAAMGIVMTAVIAILALTRNHDSAAPAPAPEPVAEPTPVDTSELRAQAELALARGEYERAIDVASKIESGPDRPRAEEIIRQAGQQLAAQREAAAKPAPAPPPVVAVTPRHASKQQAKPKQVAPATGSAAPPKPPEAPAAPAVSFDQAIARARDAAAAKQWRVAGEAARAALTVRSDPEAEMIATKAACMEHDSAAAHHYEPPRSSGSYHDIAVQFCENQGIVLE